MAAQDHDPGPHGGSLDWQPVPPASPRIGIDARAAAEVPAGRGRYVRELVGSIDARRRGSGSTLYAPSWPLPGSSWRLLGTPDPLWAAHAGVAAARRVRRRARLELLPDGDRPAPDVGGVRPLRLRPRHELPASALGERMTLPLAVRRAAGFICSPRPPARSWSSASRVPAAVRSRDPARRRTRFSPRDRRASHGGLGVEGAVRARGRHARARKNLRGWWRRSCRCLPRSGTVTARAGRRPRMVERRAGRPHRRSPRCRSVLGFVADADLPSLYAEATVFAYPSLEEGFGLPVVEAMAAGTPVITSDRSALSEVAGHACVLVDPTDTEEIADALSRLLSDAGAARAARRARARPSGVLQPGSAPRARRFASSPSVRPDSAQREATSHTLRRTIGSRAIAVSRRGRRLRFVQPGDDPAAGHHRLVAELLHSRPWSSKSMRKLLRVNGRRWV